MSEEKPKRMAIICSKGTMDMAYVPLMLASTAAAMDVETMIFYTLYGVDCVNKHKYAKLQVAPIGNPAMPTPIPIPNIIGMLPGMTAMGTMVMKSMMGKIKWPPIPEMVEICLESGVRMVACTPTLEMTGVKPSDLVEGVDVVGAAEFIDFALDSNISLFV